MAVPPITTVLVAPVLGVDVNDDFTDKTDELLGTDLPAVISEWNAGVTAFNALIPTIEAAATAEDDAAASALAAAGSATAAAGSALAADMSADAADASATAAAASATSAASSVKATSASSVTIGSGSKVFTTQSGKNFTTGTRLRVASDANPSTNFMVGVVASYSGTTLTLTVDETGGSGTYADWSISLTGTKGSAGTVGIQDTIFAITDGAAFEIDPNNGGLQTITLGANRTPKATNFANGQHMTLMVDDGTSRTLTWTDATFGGSGVVWSTDNGSAPTLATSGYTTIVLWKVGGQVYGARVGNR